MGLIVPVLWGTAIIAGVVIGMMLLQDTPDSGMSPASLDSFQITLADEGTPVPQIFGRVRIRGNIIWYGNLKTVEVKEKGGKGGSKKVTVGYKYYLDVWQTICMGPASIVKMYIDDKEKEVVSDDESFNNGTNINYPTQPGEYSSRLKGVAHIFWDQFYLGENRTSVPTVHYVMDCVPNCPLTYVSEAHGINPAAIIYYTLLLGGASATDFNISSFNQAASYWHSKGYGLNISYTKQKEVREYIKQVLSYVGGVYYTDENDLHCIKAFDPNDASEVTVETDDFIEFSFSRRSWEATYNDFRANYTSEEKEFTVRTISVRNSASIKMLGNKYQLSLDLTGFRDLESASRRLYEIMKHESYPYATITCTLPFKYSIYREGSIVTINNTDYGIENAEFRIMKRTIEGVDSNKVSWQLEQVTETLFDDTFNYGGNPIWTNPNYEVAPLTKQAVFELPYNSYTGKNKAVLLLAQREKGFEDGFIVLKSTTGADYDIVGDFTTFSQYGTLDEEYGTDVYDIDDDVGILYTPYRDDPEFVTIARESLFDGVRYAIVGNEVMTFETVTPEGTNSYRLTGVVRGLFGTLITSHSVGAGIWLTEIRSNVINNIQYSNLYLKYLPHIQSEILDTSLANVLSITFENKAATPWAVTRIEGVRSGGEVIITWWPAIKDGIGAGDLDASQIDSSLFEYEGFFQYSNNGGDYIDIDDTSITLTQSGQFTFSVRAVEGGFTSDVVTVTVGADDGIYISN